MTTHPSKYLIAVLLSALAVGMLATAILVAPPSAQAAQTRGEIIEALRKIYVHGIDRDIALEAVGEEGVDVLLELLADPDFDMRDNVVHFLHQLGDDRAALALLEFLADPGVDASIPEEDRALLLAPQALGAIAARGHDQALAALMRMTDASSEGDILQQAARAATNSDRMRDDLLHMAMRGLAYSQDARARTRLEGLKSAGTVPSARSDLRPSAAIALELFDGLQNPGEAPEAAATDEGSVPMVADSSEIWHTHWWSYGNHVDLPNPIDDVDVDGLIELANPKISAANFAGDVSCCAVAQRAGSQGFFGSSGDGLDIIDNNSELQQVLNNGVGRFKVVRLINYCNGNGGAAGCAKRPGWGIAVVHYSFGLNSSLWPHEFGHTLGRPHTSTPNYIMYGGPLSAGNVGMSEQDCEAFHTEGTPGPQCTACP